MTSLKRDKVCPQCEHRKFWFVAKVQIPTRDHETLAKSAVPMAVAVEARWTGVRHQGEFEAFICEKCGWTEWYATGLAHLKENPEAGLHFIDAEPKAGLR